MNGGTLPPGSRVGEFVIDAMVGRGAMGSVYRARRDGADHPVALKLLAPGLAGQDGVVDRFLREARTMRGLAHPNIVTVHDAGDADGRLYVAMQLYPDGNLEQLMAAGPVEPARAVALLRGVAEAVDHAHARGVVHRDIKPANILLDGDRAVLADFGLAKALDDTSMTLSGQYLGTPRYAAPEQASASTTAGPPADLYSFGCVAFELLTGSRPYEDGDALALLLAHGRRPVPRVSARRPELPAAVDAVFTRALAKEPSDRYRNAGAFVDDLGAALDGRAPVGGRRWPRRRLAVASAGTALAGAAVVAATMLVPMATGASANGAAANGTVANGAAANGAAGATLAPPAVRGPDDPVVRAATSATVPRGALLFPSDTGSGTTAWVDLVGRDHDPAHVRVAGGTAALELATLTPRADAGLDLGLHEGVTNYVGDLDLSVRPGSDGKFCWGLRWAVPGKLAYQMCVDLRAEFAQLVVWNGEQNVPITPRLPVPGLQTGRTVPFTLVVRPTHLTLLVDGAVVGDVEDHQVPVAHTLPGFDVYGNDNGTATVDIHALALYALA